MVSAQANLEGLSVEQAPGKAHSIAPVRLWRSTRRAYRKKGSDDHNRRRSLNVGLNGRDNSLGIIRLALASAVILSHAYPLSGAATEPLARISNKQETLGGVAVLGFFAISGYLISKSGSRSDVVQYLWHRMLRIFPAYWMALLVGAVVVGPITWCVEGHSLFGYAQKAGGSSLAYLTANWKLIIHQYGIYDIFATTTPYGRSVGGSVLNGSLWTLEYEWMCYMVVGALLVLGVITRARLLVILIAAALFALQVIFLANPMWLAIHLPYFADQYRISLLLIFLVGSCFAVYSNSIPLNDYLGVLSALVVLATLLTAGFALIGFPALGYFILWLAVRLPQPLRRVGAHNDYSYGIYVYGFLVEQVLAYFGAYRWGIYFYALCTLIVTVALAWLSWHAIEKQALKLKGLGPGRGGRYWARRIARCGRRRDANLSPPEGVASDNTVSSGRLRSSILVHRVNYEGGGTS